MPALILSRRQVLKAQARRVRFAVYVLALTGQPYLVPHPYVRRLRLCWSSASAGPKTIVGNF